MAASCLGGNGRLPARGRYRPMAEINVTPMVDVMLVLLVVFMVTAPLLDRRRAGRSAADPGAADQRAEGAAGHHRQHEGQIFIQDTECRPTALVPRLQAITGANPDALVYVRGDKARLRPRA